MLYGLDTAYAPSAQAFKIMFKNGWRFFGGYIGGPRALNTWSNADFGRAAAVGFTFIPIYVGRTTPWDNVAALTWDDGFQDGLEACGLAGNAGFNSEQPICLDAEYGDWETGGQAFTDYCDGFCEALHDIGHPTILYSDPRTLDAIGSHFDQIWGADYVSGGNYQTPPQGSFDPSSPPAWGAWQFGDSTRIAGVSLDTSSAADDFQFASYTPPS